MEAKKDLGKEVFCNNSPKVWVKTSTIYVSNLQQILHIMSRNLNRRRPSSLAQPRKRH